MVSRLRERQYQLAAQKHNEAFRKYDYYQQTARYFERESRNANHYNSWNTTDVVPKKEVDKARKSEILLLKRHKLRAVLQEEDANYRKDLEKLKTRKNREEESSLETLKEKLREKRAEQSLYLPRTCRRYQSYFANSKGYSPSYCSTLKGTNLQYSPVCGDSTTIHSRDRQYALRNSANMSTEENRNSKQHENEEVQQEDFQCPSPQYIDDGKQCNLKYSARYSRKSLENTNVREDEPDYVSNQGESFHLHSSMEKLASPIDDVNFADNNEPKTNHVNHSSPKANEGDGSHHEKSSSELLQDYEDDNCSEKNVADNKVSKVTDSREFESEKSLPWLRMDPTDKNLSKQMFLYLHHKELKTKIEDLSRRESHACMKHCWDEALRLRDMRNRLELIREKRLYNTDNLDLDEDVKKLGLATIHQREEELAGREEACTDSTMYSEDAKALWKKWVHEDETSVIEDARLQREVLMNSLEKEWQNLAIRDKDDISRSFENVMISSTVQEEHKLASALAAARMKSLPSPSE